jgi:hypothetical protein
MTAGGGIFKFTIAAATVYYLLRIAASHRITA